MKLKSETQTKMDAAIGSSQTRQMAKLEKFKRARDAALKRATDNGHAGIEMQRRRGGNYVGWCAKCHADLWLKADDSAHGDAAELPCR
jgi:hypothetical protein